MKGFMLKLEYKRNKYNEYVVCCYKNGEYYEPGSYHTDDWLDAIATLKCMAKDYNLRVIKEEGVFYAR